jgi:hypothetical protein
MKKKEHLLRKQYLKLTISSLKEKRNIIMKITVRQLKQLIREQVEEMAMSKGPTGGGADKLVPAVRNELKSIIKALGGVQRDDVSNTGLQIGNDILSLMDKDESGMIEDLRDDRDFREALDYLSGGTADISDARVVLKALKTLLRNGPELELEPVEVDLKPKETNVLKLGVGRAGGKAFTIEKIKKMNINDLASLGYESMGNSDDFGMRKPDFKANTVEIRGTVYEIEDAQDDGYDNVILHVRNPKTRMSNSFKISR